MGSLWQRLRDQHPTGREDPTDLRIIVGLGNPGRRYARTRHNVGFQCVDALALAHGLTFSARQFRAELAHGRIGAARVLLVKPQTFMNLSGEAVAPLLGYYRRTPADLLVIYDDLDLPPGAIRIRPHGSAGGHKGMTSIIHHLKTSEFARLRVGIGRPAQGGDPVDYVLQPFSAAERALLETVYARVVEAVDCILSAGLTEAMNRFNRVSIAQAGAETPPERGETVLARPQTPPEHTTPEHQTPEDPDE